MIRALHWFVGVLVVVAVLATLTLLIIGRDSGGSAPDPPAPAPAVGQVSSLPPSAAPDPYLLGLQASARGDWRAAREHYVAAQAAGDPRAAARIADCDRCLASQAARVAAREAPLPVPARAPSGATYTGGEPAIDGTRSGEIEVDWSYDEETGGARVTVDGAGIAQGLRESDEEFAARLAAAERRAQEERWRHTPAGRQALRQRPAGAASSTAGECPRGGAHEAGRIDQRGRLHCRKCGRFM